MEKAMTTHSSTLAWKLPWAEEPGRLQSMGSWRVGTWLSDFHFSLSCIGEGNGNPLQCSCLENPMDRGAWWAAVYGVAQSRIRLKRLSSSRSTLYFPALLDGQWWECSWPWPHTFRTTGSQTSKQSTRVFFGGEINRNVSGLTMAFFFQ